MRFQPNQRYLFRPPRKIPPTKMDARYRARPRRPTALDAVDRRTELKNLSRTIRRPAGEHYGFSSTTDDCKCISGDGPYLSSSRPLPPLLVELFSAGLPLSWRRGPSLQWPCWRRRCRRIRGRWSVRAEPPAPRLVARRWSSCLSSSSSSSCAEELSC